MRAALVGYGSIGKVHAKVIPSYGTLAAVCDIDTAVLETAPGERHYTDYVTMLEEVKPDVVHIKFKISHRTVCFQRQRNMF